MSSLCDKLMCLGARDELESKKSKLMAWLTNVSLVDFENISMFQTNNDEDEVKHFLEWVDHNKIIATTDEIVSNIDANKQILELINIKQNEIKDILIKMREIATKAADESYNHNQRKEFQRTYDNYVLRINKIQEQLQHNNTKVFEISKADDHTWNIQSCAPDVPTSLTKAWREAEPQKTSEFNYGDSVLETIPVNQTLKTSSNDAKKFREVRTDYESSNRYTYNTEDLTSLDHGNGSKANFFDNKLWGSSVVDSIRAREVLWIGKVLTAPGNLDADAQKVPNNEFEFDQNEVLNDEKNCYGSPYIRKLAGGDVLVFSKKSSVCWEEAEKLAAFCVKHAIEDYDSENQNYRVTSDVNAKGFLTDYSGVIEAGMNVFLMKLGCGKGSCNIIKGPAKYHTKVDKATGVTKRQFYYKDKDGVEHLLAPELWQNALGKGAGGALDLNIKSNDITITYAGALPCDADPLDVAPPNNKVGSPDFGEDVINDNNVETELDNEPVYFKVNAYEPHSMKTQAFDIRVDAAANPETEILLGVPPTSFQESGSGAEASFVPSLFLNDEVEVVADGDNANKIKNTDSDVGSTGEKAKLAGEYYMIHSSLTKLIFNTTEYEKLFDITFGTGTDKDGNATESGSGNVELLQKTGWLEFNTATGELRKNSNSYTITGKESLNDILISVKILKKSDGSLIKKLELNGNGITGSDINGGSGKTFNLITFATVDERVISLKSGDSAVVLSGRNNDAADGSQYVKGNKSGSYLTSDTIDLLFESVKSESSAENNRDHFFELSYKKADGTRGNGTDLNAEYGLAFNTRTGRILGSPSKAGVIEDIIISTSANNDYVAGDIKLNDDLTLETGRTYEIFRYPDVASLKFTDTCDHYRYTLVDKACFSKAKSSEDEQDISRDTAVADDLTDHIDALLVKLEGKIAEHEDDHSYICQSRANILRQRDAGYNNLERQRERAKKKIQNKICNIAKQISYLNICINHNGY